MSAKMNVCETSVDLSDDAKLKLCVDGKAEDSAELTSMFFQVKYCDSSASSLTSLSQSLLEKFDQLTIKSSFYLIDSFDFNSNDRSLFDLEFFDALHFREKINATLQYFFNLKEFKLNSRTGHSYDLELLLQEKLGELGISFNPISMRIDCEDPSCLHRTEYLGISYYDEEQIYADECVQLFLKYYTALIGKLTQCFIKLRQRITILRRLISEAIRLQFIANHIRNRISRNPNPQKKEPPIGGVKIGGEYHLPVTLPRILYAKPILTFETSDLVLP